MESMKTLIIVILDESGSMGPKKSDVIGGLNAFIEEQKKIENDTARLYLVKFNTIVNTVHSGLPLADVPPLTEQNYVPGGSTALYDAIAEGVRLAKKDKTAEERVICVIMTDGEENSSRETTKQQVKDLISGHESEGDWTFLYIGENPERWARESGMSANHAINYDHKSHRVNSKKASEAVSGFRKTTSSKGTDLFSNTSKTV